MSAVPGLRATKQEDRVSEETETFVRLAGWAGIGAFIAYLVGFGFYLMAGPPPAFTDAERFVAYARDHGALIISSALFFGIDFALLFVWFTGVRDLIRRAGGIWTSLADATAYAYFAGVAIAIVGFGALIGAAVSAQSLGDPAVTRGLWFGCFTILHISLLPLALVQALYAVAVLRTGALPRWNGWLGGIAALGALAAVPGAYGGTGFYSSLGLAGVLLSDVPSLVWNLAAAIVMVRFTDRSGGPRKRTGP